MLGGVEAYWKEWTRMDTPYHHLTKYFQITKISLKLGRKIRQRVFFILTDFFCILINLFYKIIFFSQIIEKSAFQIIIGIPIKK